MSRISNQFKTKLQTYLIKRLGAFKYKHGWLRLPICPYCKRENKMGVHLSLYRTNCFRCNAHPNPAQLIMDVENLETWSQLITLLNNGDFTEFEFKEDAIELSKKVPVYLPDGFKNISFGTSELAKSIRRYVIRRGLNIQNLSRLGIGYCDKGPLFGYLIIPFYYGSELRYFNARNVLGKGPRYNNPNKDITGCGKEFIIYNYDALSMYRTVYVCEGAINAITMGERGIATMGKAVSAYQVNEFIKSSCERFIILLDPDAKEKAVELALKLVNFKKVKVVFLPDGEDVNSIGRKEVMRLVWRSRYLDYRNLIKLKNSI